ncbi:hypothetical protein AYX14_07018 [Cryptococcus neoformans]|nr:hypothetical protein AYX14_07018 [Cryptococcus neoformans var. grubii]
MFEESLMMGVPASIGRFSMVWFDLEHMAVEIVKGHVHDDPSLKLGAKSSRDIAENVMNEQSPQCWCHGAMQKLHLKPSPLLAAASKHLHL